MKIEVAAKFDVVIIGSGISGLICAIELAKNNKSVCILTKEAVTESSSQYAQGGIAVPIGDDDSINLHLEDTLKAGAGLCDSGVAREIISSSKQALEKLISYGVKFDLTQKNKIHQTKEAAHSVARVCHVGGDASGRYISKTLIDKACREQNVSISQGTVVLGLLKDEDNRVQGVIAEDVTRNRFVILAKDIINASGGIGQLFQYTTNPFVCTGDGMIFSYQAGAVLQDIEMIQFHPTVLLEHGDVLLITEAIRGEGAKLKNINGEYFANNYHPRGELAPRDILARAILNEMKKTKSSCVYLDLSSFDKSYFEKRFPTIYNECTERNIDLFGLGVPVFPAAHYSIGGVKCDLSGRTRISNLWVVGESASNGFHGANRLASNSLLECIVVPHILSIALLSSTNNNDKFFSANYIDIQFDNKQYNENEITKILLELKLKNNSVLGLVRSEISLKEHLNWLNKLHDRFSLDILAKDLQEQEVKNMMLLSELITMVSLARKHSLGVHFREDFPEAPVTLKHSILTKNNELSWESQKKEKELISFPE